MLKSKFVFLLVLFSLLLNITHDIVLASEFNKTCSVGLEDKSSMESELCCGNLIDLHEAFHFTAILSSLIETSSLHLPYAKPSFISLSPLRHFCQNSFRPPIV